MEASLSSCHEHFKWGIKDSSPRGCWALGREWAQPVWLLLQGWLAQTRAKPLWRAPWGALSSSLLGNSIPARAGEEPGGTRSETGSARLLTCFLIPKSPSQGKTLPSRGPAWGKQIGAAFVLWLWCLGSLALCQRAAAGPGSPSGPAALAPLPPAFGEGESRAT